METTATLSTLTFECIDGKDDHFKIEIENGQKIILGCGEAMTFIKELENQGGCVIVSHENGQLHIDASDCTVPVKINGNIIAKAIIRPIDVVKIGNSIWKYWLPATETSSAAAHANAVKKKFNTLIGLEELQDFKLKEIFSKVFQKHSLVDMEDQLVTGTFNNTPALTDIETSWAKPWLFSRMLLFSIIACFILVTGFNMFENINLVPGIIFVGSFAVPVSTLIFFLEMNAPRNISIFFTMMLMLMGGVVSLFVTLIFFDRLEFLQRIFSTPAAGIIEESAKILCVILIMGRLARYKWVLNGLLFGAAIGTGFAAFESAGYALNFMLQNNFSTGLDIIILRGMLAPFGHIIWTGNAAAALWLVKGDKKFSWSMVKDMRFVRVLLSSVLLHMLWDTSFSLIPLPFVGDVKYLILGVVGWIITFRLIQTGLKQLNEARHAEVERLRAE